MTRIKRVSVCCDRSGCEFEIGDRVEVCGPAPWYKTKGYGKIIAMGTENFSWKTCEDWRLYAADPFNPTVLLDNGKQITCHSSFIWKQYGVEKTLWDLFGLRIRRFYQTRQHSLWWLDNVKLLEL